MQIKPSHVYYKGKALNELIRLVLVDFLVGYYFIANSMDELPIAIITRFFLRCLISYRVYYWCKKSESTKSLKYMLPICLSLVAHLYEVYYSLTDPTMLLTPDDTLALFVSLTIGIYHFIIHIQGYVSLKSTMKTHDIELGLLGAKRSQLERFKPNKQSE